jgi:hypothetical protein
VPLPALDTFAFQVKTVPNGAGDEIDGLTDTDNWADSGIHNTADKVKRTHKRHLPLQAQPAITL